jgi:hypothetical protein
MYKKAGACLFSYYHPENYKPNLYILCPVPKPHWCLTYSKYTGTVINMEKVGR